MAQAEHSVRLAGSVVGSLAMTGSGEWRFRYLDTQTRADGIDLPPVGLALPRTRREHSGDKVTAVFGGLLPDGSLRQRLAASLGLSQGNDFALLGWVGQECHGALSIQAPGRALLADRSARALSEKELRDAVAVLPVHPLLADVDGLAKTLPGEFDKLPISFEAGTEKVIVGAELTSHIIKPAKPGLRETVMNEAYCMDLAAAFGLPTAPARVRHGKSNVLLVQRVDRLHDGPLTALHMEDFAQALGYLPAQKYEREGGPRLADIARLLRSCSTQPALDLRALLRWLIFSFLIGFGAAHGRQIALRYEARGPSLAPFFGLWSTHVYREMSYRMGFLIGREDRPDWLSAARWADCARELGVRPRYALEELRTAATELPALAREVAESFQRRNGFAEIVRAIRHVVDQRARQLLVSLEAEGKNDFPSR